LSTQFLQVTAGRERHLPFLEAEPELYIVNSFISNSDMEPDGLRLQNLGGLAQGVFEICVG
jgi:hypothetical protein